jgi:hypothetical protein
MVIFKANWSRLPPPPKLNAYQFVSQRKQCLLPLLHIHHYIQCSINNVASSLLEIVLHFIQIQGHFAWSKPFTNLRKNSDSMQKSPKMLPETTTLMSANTRIIGIHCFMEAGHLNIHILWKAKALKLIPGQLYALLFPSLSRHFGLNMIILLFQSFAVLVLDRIWTNSCQVTEYCTQNAFLLAYFNTLSAKLKAAFSVNIPFFKPNCSGTSILLVCK